MGVSATIPPNFPFPCDRHPRHATACWGLPSLDPLRPATTLGHLPRHAGGSPIWSRSFKPLGPTGHLSHLPGARSPRDPSSQHCDFTKTSTKSGQGSNTCTSPLDQLAASDLRHFLHLSISGDPSTTCIHCRPHQHVVGFFLICNMPTPPLAQTTNFALFSRVFLIMPCSI